MKFQKGQSGNPKGRPKKGQSLTDLMREYLNKSPEGQKLSYKELFVERVFKMAVEDRDTAAIKLIWNYVDGLPESSIDDTIYPTKFIITEGDH